MVDFISRDGVRLAYATEGQGDPAMVFIHGWSCDRTYFAPQIDHFATRHAVVSMDLRGQGDSAGPAPTSGRYDIEVLADDVFAVVEAAGLAAPVLVGHSTGALVALSYASRHPDARAVVMVDPAPITNEPAKEFFRTSVDAVAADHDRSWRSGFIGGMFMATDTVRRAAIVSEMTAVAPDTAAALIAAIADFDGVGALGRVAAPVLSIGSAGPSNRPDDLRAACPTITIGQTVGAGHFHQLEVPDQVNAMIERFMTIMGR